MGTLVSYVIIGILATAGMTTFLWILNAARIADVDMIKAIGSFYTRNEDNALLPGTLVHFSSGIFFTFVYIFLFHIFPSTDKDPFIYVLFGGGLGFGHGIVTSMFLVMMISDFHPLERYKRAGFKVAVFHFLAHVIFGLIIGILYATFMP